MVSFCKVRFVSTKEYMSNKKWHFSWEMIHPFYKSATPESLTEELFNLRLWFLYFGLRLSIGLFLSSFPFPFPQWTDSPLDHSTQLTSVHNTYSNGSHTYKTFRYSRLITLIKLKNLLMVAMKNQGKVNKMSTVYHYPKKPWRYLNSRNPIRKNVGISKGTVGTNILNNQRLTFWRNCRTASFQRQWWYRIGKEAARSECNAGFGNDAFLWWYGSTSNVTCFVSITTSTARDHSSRRHFPSHSYSTTLTQLWLLGIMPPAVPRWRTGVIDNVACASV